MCKALKNVTVTLSYDEPSIFTNWFGNFDQVDSKLDTQNGLNRHNSAIKLVKCFQLKVQTEFYQLLHNIELHTATIVTTNMPIRK